MKFNDLYCGAGGLAFGFKQAGATPQLAIDIDRYSVDSWNFNIGGTAYQGRVRDFNEFIDDSYRAELTIGGIPCQGFTDSSRINTLSSNRQLELEFLREEWTHFLDGVLEAKSHTFLVENVVGFTDSLEYRELLERASSNGFKMATWILNASEYGVPQKRIRAFIIGTTRDICLKPPTPLSRMATLKDAIADLDFDPSNPPKRVKVHQQAYGLDDKSER